MATQTYELIASTTLSANNNTIAFSSIPQTYQHLTLLCSVNMSTAATTSIIFQPFSGNGTTAQTANYSTQTTNGGSITGNNNTAQNQFNFMGTSTQYVRGQNFWIINVNNYTSTTANYRTFMTFGGVLGSDTYCAFGSGTTTLNSAINYVQVQSSGNMLAGSSVSLYGLLGA